MRRESEESLKRTSIPKFDENLKEKYIPDTTVEPMAKKMERPNSLVQTATSKLEGLQKEVENLKEARNCKICMEREASIVFLPCGHLCCCTNCAPALQICAVCRSPIQGLVRTFMV
eukprot:GFUD01028656.1.p1 GENE.GFUD01028656.1~~GFUD01028656.1.p1  ORF type:complete len:116 (-),score=34.37 GFUD01028656.1:226-573(-)